MKDNELKIIVSPWICHINGIWSGRYGIEAANTWPVGRHLAILNSRLRNLVDLSTKTFCVGHSLGAHVCGFMGRESDVQLDKIIGMDPAGPIFENNFEHDRLNSGNAKIVEAIHTNTGGFGLEIKKPVGTRDIYFNGGKKHPHCSGTLKICSHGILYKILTNLNKGNETCEAKYKCLDFKKLGSITAEDIQALHDASCKLLDTEEDIPQLGLLPRNNSDDDQIGIFWIDVREGSSMCNVTGLTIASLNIKFILLIPIIGLILILFIYSIIFIIQWCSEKNKKNATVDVELLVQSQHFKKYGTKNPNDVNLVDQ